MIEEAWIRNVTYKPNVQFDLRKFSNRHFQLRISFEVTCSRTGQTITVVHQHVEYSGVMSEDQFYRYVHGRCRQAEVHECDEFFKVYGHRMFEPHTETQLDTPKFAPEDAGPSRQPPKLYGSMWTRGWELRKG